MKKTIQILTIFCFLLCTLLLSGCAAGNESAWREYKEFCGMSSNSGEVPEDAWRRFCDKHVSAAFPDGYTVLDAAGYWRSGSDATAKERAKVILVIAREDAKEKVLSVARQYQKEFDQSAVLISSCKVEMDVIQAKSSNGKKEDVK